MRPRLELIVTLGGAVITALVAASISSNSAEVRTDPIAEGEARDYVQRTVDEVMGVLRDAGIPVEEKKRRIEQLAYERFDFAIISRLVLARNWKKFSETQRADFTDAFKQHLSVTYRDTIDNFTDETITIEGTRLERRGDVTVKSLVHRSADTVDVNYRMRKTDAGWRGIDVIIENVSLVQNFRAQAQEIVSNHGPDGLIQRLRDKHLPKPASNSDD